MSGRVPPSSRAASRPKLSQRADVRKAAALYERFTGHAVDSIDRVSVPAMPRILATIGELDGVLYTTVRDGRVEKYIHHFRKSDRPLLCVSPDGRSLHLVGGRYRFTELGIVDDSDLKHRRAR